MARLSAMIALVIGLVLAGPQNVVAQEAAQSGNKPDRTALPTDPSAQAQTSAEFDRTTLLMPRPPFEGTIGTTYKDSKSAWPRLPSPPSGAPNVVIILLDDVGFGQVSTFGGPVPTPNLDQLAQQGLRWPKSPHQLAPQVKAAGACAFAASCVQCR